jgi:hypothetical protein
MHLKIISFCARLLACTILATLYANQRGAAQTVQVDITPKHATNHFRPNETLGAGIDRIPPEAIDSGLSQPNLARALASGWQPVSYRNNTELSIESWHWNPQGTWSDPGQKGYFTGSTTSTEPIRYSYGYSLPHRGFTRNDGTPNAGFSRLTDGDNNTYWKSNPYLTQHFTGESDTLHPQWVIIDLTQIQQIDSIQIKWSEPYARKFLLQHWADFPFRRDRARTGRPEHPSIECEPISSSLSAYPDDRILQHLRTRRECFRSASLRWLRHQ